MSDTVASTRVITPVTTLSYPWIATPQSPKLDKAGNPVGNPKFSGAFLFAPGTDMSALEAAANAAAEAAYPGKGANMLKTGALRSPFRRDCEAKHYDPSICAVFINARTEQKPGAVYNYKDPATGKAKVIPDDKIADELYAGAQVKASLNAFAYNTDGNKGISFGLNNIQKVGEGERLDGRAAAENEFTDDLSEAPAEDLPF